LFPLVHRRVDTKEETGVQHRLATRSLKVGRMRLYMNRHCFAEGGYQGGVECYMALATLAAQALDLCIRTECETYNAVVKGSDHLFLGSAGKGARRQERSEKRESVEEDRSPHVMETRNRI
jgi:hypothetical protein